MEPVLRAPYVIFKTLFLVMTRDPRCGLLRSQFSSQGARYFRKQVGKGGGGKHSQQLQCTNCKTVRRVNVSRIEIMTTTCCFLASRVNFMSSHHTLGQSVDHEPGTSPLSVANRLMAALCAEKADESYNKLPVPWITARNKEYRPELHRLHRCARNGQ